MSGHSKWAQIKHKKAATDAKRGNLFGKLAKAITVAAKEGGADTAINARLRLAVERARTFNMPSDNIERAVLRGTQGKEGGELSEVLYEAYAPGGSALLIEGVTDNKNRTAAEVKHILTEHGGKLAGAGAVAWMFERRGVILLSFEQNPALKDPETDLLLIDLGAQDILRDPEGITIFMEPPRRQKVIEALRTEGVLVTESYDEMAAQSPLNEHTPAASRLIEALESHDDVQHVWSNLSDR